MKRLFLIILFIPKLTFADTGLGFDTDILKIDDYDVTGIEFADAENSGCAQLVACNFDGAIEAFERNGLDFIHVYPAIRCDNSSGNYSPIVFTQKNRPIPRCVEQIIHYIIERGHQDNQDYASQIFNLVDDEGGTLLDRYHYFLLETNNPVQKQRLRSTMKLLEDNGARRLSTKE